MKSSALPKNRRPGPSSGQIPTSPIIGGHAITLGDWGDIWYEDYRSQVQPSTHDGDQFTLQIINRRLGDAPVEDILPSHINLFMTELTESGYGMPQIHKSRSILIQLFDATEDNGLVSRNPARQVVKILRDLDGSLSQLWYEEDVFTDEKVETLRRELPDDLLGNNIRLLMDTGLRVQELIALASEDISKGGSSVGMDKAIKMASNIPQMDSSKIQYVYRLIPVPEKSRACALSLKYHGGKPLIWRLPDRKPYYSVRCFRHRYCNALNRIKSVRYLPSYCCYHTYGTRLQARGEPLEMIARLAAPSTASETEVYAYLFLKTLASAVNALYQKPDGRASA